MKLPGNQVETGEKGTYSPQAHEIHMLPFCCMRLTNGLSVPVGGFRLGRSVHGRAVNLISEKVRDIHHSERVWYHLLFPKEKVPFVWMGFFDAGSIPITNGSTKVCGLHEPAKLLGRYVVDVNGGKSFHVYRLCPLEKNTSTTCKR